ncbi:hypothetical protein COY51_05660 [Candidatus Desantisbacteria bacterium CG_4_10_14_0_8_um_filter_39_17]|uniref:Phosphoribosylformylglycinamidine synthase n=1 Tax=Candidatus Desantisbacteria bacterium CG_4_10_14_0_8_um_filter_39_17 TaxID=1974542 RepID=A0A2H9PA86_9BACT|nr:MAG: hypothetical protein COY51_05660 [Candidatus Desantisbacteria bacterium CG_4_10_14_0_8_um_filter_39_17]
MQWLIEVSYKPKFFDAFGNTVKKDIEDLGVLGAKKVRTSKLYHIEGDLKEKELRFLCQELLTDNIVQQYKIRSSIVNHPPKKNKNAWIVEVWYKKGVTDAVADTVKKGMIDLGIQGINTVKTGYEYIIIGNITLEQIERICRGLLANKVVQDYVVAEFTLPQKSRPRSTTTKNC